MTRPYHHGSLRSTLLQAAVEAVTASGPANLSMRELARRAGVSYAASAHHFGDKAGLLTALAAQGYDLLADALDAARQSTGDFVDVGVAYVQFAIDHRAHFEVMYRPDLVHTDDQALVEAQRRAEAALYEGIGDLTEAQSGGDTRIAALAAWSIVHGFASLLVSGTRSVAEGNEPDVTARKIAALLFRTC